MTDQLPEQPESDARWAPPPPPIGGELPLYGAPPPPPQGPTRSTVSNGRFVAIILSAVAVIAASVFAVSALTAGDGAESPEAAVDELFNAIDAEDAVGAVGALAPGERRALLEPMEDIVGELQRLGVLEEFSLDQVPGAAFAVDGLAYETTELADGVVVVKVVDGTITSRTIPEEIPYGPILREQIEADGGSLDDNAFAEPASVSSFADEPFEFVTVQEDGGWHVSLAYTIIASASDEESSPLGQIGGGPDPVGAADPESAVRDLVDAAVNLDAERAVTLLPPDEMRAVYDFAPLFLPDAAQSAQEARDEGFELIVDDLALSVDGDGDTRRVRFESWDVSWSSEDSSGSTTFDGECVTESSTYTYSYGYDYGYEYEEGYESFEPIYPDDTESPTTSLPVSGESEPEVETETYESEFCRGDDLTADEDSFGSSPFMMAALGDWTPALTVVEVDGRWYVSPVRSVLDSVVEALEGMTPEDLDGFFDLFLGRSVSTEFEEVGEAIDDSSYFTPLPDAQYEAMEECYLLYEALQEPLTDEEWEVAFQEIEACGRAALGDDVYEEYYGYGYGSSTDTTMVSGGPGELFAEPEPMPTTTIGVEEPSTTTSAAAGG